MADKTALTGRERASRHRALEKERDLQIAVAAARMVLGQHPGDAGRSLAAFMKKVGRREDVPEDYLELITSAAATLESRLRRRY